MDLYNILSINGISISDLIQPQFENLIVKENNYSNNTVEYLNSVKMYVGNLNSNNFININNIHIFDTDIINNNTFENIFNMNIIYFNQSFLSNSFYHINNADCTINYCGNNTFNEFNNFNINIDCLVNNTIQNGFNINLNARTISSNSFNNMNFVNITNNIVENNIFKSINNLNYSGINRLWTNGDIATSKYIDNGNINWNSFENNLSIITSGLFFSECKNITLDIIDCDGLICFYKCNNVNLHIYNPRQIQNNSTKYLSLIIYNAKNINCKIDNTYADFTHLFTKIIT